ncbi:PD-(D/E)XK nuclease family protein [Adhaeribacter arboris]|nr:PD-(D/E)XK nuclease family protein [Adhaeribacter arboris]
MNKIGKIEYKEIKRISPSQFYSIKSCAYKSILAEAFEKKPLLPVSPNAYLGTVLHKILELISIKEIKTDFELETRFDAEINSLEKRLLQEGNGFITPLQKSVKDYGIKKIQLKKHLSNLPRKIVESKAIAEKWFESKDGLIGGKIDLILEIGQDIEIIDFKTGAITQDTLNENGEISTEIKDEYLEQLKLYAYLFYECTSRFPTRLSLVDLAKQKISIEFSLEECKAAFDDAKKVLAETNKSISTGFYNANVNEKNCIYCLYRPACSFYLKNLSLNNVYNDVSGFIKNVVQYSNGNITVLLDNGCHSVTVTGFTNTNPEYFISKRNRLINIFNLRKGILSNVYSATKTTTIYE